MLDIQSILRRIKNGALLGDSMFSSLDTDNLLQKRDDSFDVDWVRAAELLQLDWENHPEAELATPGITAIREAAFLRTFNASGGNHDLAATVSDDFDLICRRTLLEVEIPFITALEKAYDKQQFPQ